MASQEQMRSFITGGNDSISFRFVTDTLIDVVTSSSSSSSRTLVFLKGSRTIEDFHKIFYLSITFRIQKKRISVGRRDVRRR